MHSSLDFQTEVDLENFISHLKIILPDSSIFILDSSNNYFIYDFKAENLNKSLFTIIKKKIVLNELTIGKQLLQHEAYRYELMCNCTFIHILEKKMNGQLFLVHFLQQTYQPHTKLENTLSLTDTFHSVSIEMQRMFSIIQRVAITEFPVLVRGESGSGKELVAKAIHDYSQRKNHVFIPINCAALNANILESELFGHVKGAFTGAIREHKGVFERATGGTLFLDEIAEIPLELQAKLLRVLETGEFTPLGGENSIKANVRIITATHRALREEAKLGRFRQDLLYRLRVIPIFVPPLRQRKDDIPIIANFILNEQKDVFDATPLLSNAALQTLMAYDWPGNVRELKNTLLYALTMANEKSEIDIIDLPDEIINNQCVESSLTTDITHVIMPKKIDEEIIIKVLIQSKNDFSLAAKTLGISRTTLWRYRKKLNL